MKIINKIFNIKNKNVAYLDDIDLLSKKIQKHIFLICAPKSGSTWLTKVLIEILRWPTVKLLPAYGHREQEIDLFHLFSNDISGKIITPHQHLRYSDYTTRIISSLDSVVILQVRNIFDTIISYRDHLENENVKVPAAYMDYDNWNLLSENEKLSFVVDLVVPWYFNFYCGWVSSDLYKENKLKIITYAEMKNDTIFSVKNILDYIGESRNETEVEEALNKLSKKNTRKNIGISGRGKKLPEKLRKKVLNYTKYYPKIDFKLLGINKEEK